MSDLRDLRRGNLRRDNLICLDERAFYAVFHELVEKVKFANEQKEDPWVGTDEAMRLLRITSKTTLKKFCNNGDIRVSRLTDKHLLYYRESILSFIEQRSNLDTNDGA